MDFFSSPDIRDILILLIDFFQIWITRLSLSFMSLIGSVQPDVVRIKVYVRNKTLSPHVVDHIVFY